MTVSAATYARVSTSGQAGNDPWASLPQQQADLRQLAARMGFTIALEVEEQGSGAKADRPGWQSVLAAARAGTISAILVVAFDRVTRSERIGDFEDLKHELRGLKVRLVTIKNGEVDLSGTSDGELRSDMDAVLSKRERLVTKERTSKGREEKARAGGFYGHPTPYGWRHTFDPDTGRRRFHVHEPEAAIVRRIFAAYLAGTGQTSIAIELNQEGIPTARGAQWTARQIKCMLQNALYAGMSEYRKPHIHDPRSPRTGDHILVPSTEFPAIVTMAQFEAAQSERTGRLTGRAQAGDCYPLTGILVCEGCGGTMAITVPATGGHAYYQCGEYRHARKCPAPTYYNAHEAHRLVLRALKLSLPRRVNEARRSEVLSADGEPANAAVEEARRELAGVASERQGMIMLASRGLITDADLSRGLARLESSAAAIERRLAGLLDTTATSERQAEREAMLVNLARAVQGFRLDHPRLRELFRLSLSAVHLAKGGRDPKDKRKVLLKLARIQLITGDWVIRR